MGDIVISYAQLLIRLYVIILSSIAWGLKDSGNYTITILPNGLINSKKLKFSYITCLEQNYQLMILRPSKVY